MQINLSRPVWQYVLLLLFIALVAGVGLRHPWPADEPRFALVAMEMVDSGQWLFPTRAGELYPDKPPVFMWLIAVFYSLLGNLNIAFLLPSLLAGLVTAVLVYDMARRLYNGEVAMLALLMLVVAPQFILQAKTAQIDALLCMFVTLGVYGFVRHFLLGPAWSWFAIGWIAMGLGVMTKGVGFLPLLLLLPLFIWRKQNETAASWRYAGWFGPLVMLAVIACWLGPMLYQVHSSGNADFAAYRDNILFRQTATRYLNPWHHQQVWHYFLSEVMPMMWFPLPFLFLVGWRSVIRLWREDVRFRVLLCWVAMVVAFFSFSTGKRGVYIYPALPVFTIVCAVLWLQLSETIQRWFGRIILGLVSVVLLVFTLSAVASMLQLLTLPTKLLPYQAAIAEIAPWLLVVAVLSTVSLYVLRKGMLFWRLAVLVISNWVFVALVLWPQLDPFRTPEAVMAKVEQLLPANAELGTIEFKEQLLLFAKRPVVQFSYLSSEQEQIRRGWYWQRQGADRYILLSSDVRNVSECFNLASAIELGDAHRRDWYLIPPAAALASCDAPQQYKQYQFIPKAQ